MTPEPNDKPLIWAEFQMFAQENGIGLEHREDWWAWWECYMAGYQTGRDTAAEDYL